MTVPAQAPGKSRHRLLFVSLGVVVLLILGGALALAISSAANKVGNANSEPLDPKNPGNGGAQALARVIASHGVDVEIVRSQTQLLDADRPDANTTVVVAGADPLSTYTADKLREQVRGAARLVLLDPKASTLSALSLPVTSDWGSTSITTSVRAGCDVFGIAASDMMTASPSAYTPTVPYTPTTSCFKTSPDADGTGASNVLVLQAISPLPEVVVASGEQFTNAQITRLDNAGVAVRMLGGHDRLLWYIPSDKDIPPSQSTGPSDIPRAIGPLIALSFVALLAAMFWRGRRFGKLVVEPLPAVVKAIETTQARGRLYHRAGDAARAASRLRDHTIRRITKSLGLPAQSELGDVIDSAATASGSDRGYLIALLDGPLPTTEDQLLQFANDLSRIEEEVHRRYD
ncbi:DUF4350 domain-containing protein [Gordonia sp. CPCC 205333]|uniref:DUF4350 domain-containing protein n=1 Tax=Gordonia sp. CPCC 205333 TaxID=3140790 RepID=UPI003AF3729A